MCALNELQPHCNIFMAVPWHGLGSGIFYPLHFSLSQKKKKISKGLIKLCFDEIVAVVDRKHIFADF